jgi:hypothetical protein
MISLYEQARTRNHNSRTCLLSIGELFLGATDAALLINVGQLSALYDLVGRALPQARRDDGLVLMSSPR